MNVIACGNENGTCNGWKSTINWRFFHQLDKKLMYLAVQIQKPLRTIFIAKLHFSGWISLTIIFYYAASGFKVVIYLT